MKVNHIYKISDKPAIYLSIGSGNWNKLENKEKEPAYLLTHPMWFFTWGSVFLYWKQKILLRKKNIKLILLSNSKKEHLRAKLTGFTSFFINQNIQVCENSFYVKKEEKKVYDAVYIAAAKPYKRLHLAQKIKSLYVITYFWPDIRDKDGNWDLHAFEPKIRHAKFNKRRLDKEQINKILNQSKCGLALSKKEGAMLASMEYLYSGLPIVSTKSIGGRDFFFDDRYVIIAKDDPEHIQKAVEQIISKKIDPDFIRKETLKKVNEHRKEFYKLIQLIYNKHNKKLKEDFPAFKERIWGGKGIEQHLFYPKQNN